MFALELIVARFQSLLLCAVLIVVAPAASVARKRPVAQPDMDYGCITISNIYFHADGLWTRPGLDAIVHSTCQAVAVVTLSFVYFDQDNVKHPGEGSEIVTAAPGDSVYFHHLATWERDRWHLKLVKIASVKVSLP